MLESSGHGILDEAPLDAVRRAVPFDPPGVEVLGVIPAAFRLRASAAPGG